MLSKEQNINQFLAEQIQNSLRLLNQNTTIGNTHVLYSKAIVDSIGQVMVNVGNTLQQNSIAPIPIKNQKPATEKSVEITESSSPQIIEPKAVKP